MLLRMDNNICAWFPTIRVPWAIVCIHLSQVLCKVPAFHDTIPSNLQTKK